MDCGPSPGGWHPPTSPQTRVPYERHPVRAASTSHHTCRGDETTSGNPFVYHRNR
ncbi:hypothetical protein BN2537_9437 [Streptomyces venezuelae]|nr:hypothetical protein BN2537_9437 [Streptomyces venezuelae]